MRVTRHPYEIEGWGVGELWVGDGTVVVAHDPPVPAARLAPGVSGPSGPITPETPPRGTRGVPTETLAHEPTQESNGFVPELLQRLHSYFSGRPVSFADVPLEAEWGTDFQAALAYALRRVPWGDVVSYGELSRLAGRARAARAAGSFCAGNRFAIFLPCHRVVSAAGLGGYGGLGLGYKRRLLALEGHGAL